MLRIRNIIMLMSLLLISVVYADNNIAFTDSQTPIAVTKSSPKFTLNLKSNPTTGYSWELQSADAKFLKVESHHYVAPEKAMPGQGGYEQWNFKVKHAAFKSKQPLTITMVYKRPWEKTVANSVNFNVVVK